MSNDHHLIPKKWFGKSHAADSAGKPILLYHGTNEDAPFAVFEHGHHSGQPTRLRGFFFTDSRHLADAYSQGSGTVIEAYLSIQSPLVVDMQDTPLTLFELHDEVEKHLRGLASIFEGQTDDPDGLIVRNAREGLLSHTEYVVFDPTQIKTVGEVAGMVEVNGDTLPTHALAAASKSL